MGAEFSTPEEFIQFLTVTNTSDFEKYSPTCQTPIEIKLSGLQIFPVRYALLDKEFSYTNFFNPNFITLGLSNGTSSLMPIYSPLTGPQKSTPKTVSPVGMPSLSGRQYVLSPLRPGWVYIFNTTKKKWYEYEVLSNLLFKKCEWKSPVPDIRPANDIVLDFIELGLKDTFYLAYSDIQWSQKYLAILESSEDERKKKMQMIDASKVAINEKVDHVIDPTSADLILNSSTLTLAKGHDALTRAPANLYYVGLHDPIGIADQLALEIANDFEQIEALVQSVQTGIDPAIVRNSLKEGKDPSSLQNKATLEQAMALHKMALTLYQIGFGTPANIKKLGSNLDKARIEKLLAVKERKEIRDKLSKNQDTLTTYLKTDYYQKSLGAYRDNTKERKVFGKMRISSHLPWIATPPHAKDNLLDLPEKGTTDKQKASMTFLAETLQEKNELGKIIAENSPVSLTNVGFEHAVIQTWDNILGSFVELAKNNTTEMTTIIRRLNSIQIIGLSDPFFEELDLLAFHKRVKLLGNPKVYPLFNSDISETLIHIEKMGGKVVEVKQLSLSEKVVQMCKPDHGMYWIAERLTNSPKWNKFVLGIAYVNLGASLFGLFKGNNKLGYARELLSVAGACADVVETLKALQRIAAISKGADQAAIIAIENAGTRLTAAGYFIGAAVSAIDSGINFYEGDWDAATLYGIAAVLGIITGIGVLNIWNPLGLIALFVATLGAGIIATLLEDPPLERFVKNCILRSGLSIKVLSQPSENTLEIVKNNPSNVKYGFDTWKDLVISLRDLMDIVFGYSVKTKLDYVEPYDPNKNNKSLWNKIVDVVREGIAGTNYQVNSITTNVTFRMFTENVSHLEYELRIYPKGLKKFDTFSTLIKDSGEKLTYSKDDKGVVSAAIKINVPYDVHKTLQGYGDVLLITRLHYNKSLIFPENNRYVGVRNSTLWNTGSAIGAGESGISASQLTSALTYSNIFGDKVRIGTVDEILNEKYWIKT